MAVGFNGFQTGKEIGAGLAKPIDLSPTVNFIFKRGMQQQQLHQQMLNRVAQNIDAFNPKGVMRQDMPIVMDKYNKWRELEMSHPEAVFNPKSPYFRAIDDARKDLYSTTASLIDGAKQVSDISKIISQSELKDRRLSPEAVEKFDYLMNNGIGAYRMKYPDDMNLEQTFIPNIHEAQMEVLKNIRRTIPVKTKSASNVEGDVLTNYTVPVTGYSGLITDAKRTYNGFGRDEKEYYEDLFNTMSDDELASHQENLKSTFDSIPDKVLGRGVRKFIDNFQIKSPEDLYIYDKMIQNPAIPGTSKVSPEHSAELQDKKERRMEMHQRISEGQSAARLGQAAARIETQNERTFESQVDSALKEEEASYNRAAKANDTTPMTPELRQQRRKEIREAIAQYRIRNGQWVPLEFRPQAQSSFTGKDPFSPL